MCDHNIHPLLINHVVEKILEYFINNGSPLCNLLLMRQVCKVWNQIGIKYYRKCSRGFITFGRWSPHQVHEIRDITHLIKSSFSNFPCANFAFGPEVFREKNETLVQDFFAKCGSVVKCLVIRLDHFSRISTDEIIFPMKLTTLDFEDGRDTFTAFEKFFHNLLNASRNSLRVLTMRRKVGSSSEFVEWNENIEHEAMLDRICSAFDEHPFPLKHLHTLQIDLKVNDKLLLCLTMQCNHLKHLSLNLKQSTFETESLREFLEMQEHTLEKLRLCGLCEGSNFQVTFPHLRRLECLDIRGCSSCSTLPSGQSVDVSFAPFSLYENFPNLIELNLHMWSNANDNSGWNQFFLTESDTTVKKLKLPEMFEQFDLIQNVSSGFTALKRLELHYRPTMECNLLFWKVFECLEKLEELVIRKSVCDINAIHDSIDSLLTGIPEEECCRMLRICNFSLAMTSQTRETYKSSLRNLKNLKCLDLRDVLVHQTTITDVTGYVLLSLDNLRQLKIRKSKIRRSCFYQLYTKFPNDLQKELEALSPETKEEPFELENCHIT